MKQAHRKAIIAALAGAGLLAGNIAFGATDYMEYKVGKGEKVRSHISQKVERGKLSKHRQRSQQT